MNEHVEKARAFAQKAHEGQTRKYTGEPYFNHCEEVARLCEEYGCDNDSIAAAYLHDVLEDTPVRHSELVREFGYWTANLVWWLTDQSRPWDGNRARRKAIDREHIASAPPAARTIKLADLVSNTSTIVQYDPDFAKVYLVEKILLLHVLKGGNPELHRRALTMAQDGLETIKAARLVRP